MLGSVAVVGQVFALGALGQSLLTAVKSGDLMVIMGTTLVAVVRISLVNLITDTGQALLDPRVKLT